MARNVDEMPESSRPCLILIDGDERRSDTSRAIGLQPLVIMMNPVIAIGVSASPHSVGPDVNELRAKILPAVLGDSQLTSLLTANGRIQYDGANGKLSHGSFMADDLELLFTLHYVFKPNDFI